MKQKTVFIFVLLLAACSPQTKNSDVVSSSTITDTLDSKTSADTSYSEISLKKDALIIFIDSMRSVDYLIDTNRIKEISAWKQIAKCPKQNIDGNIAILFPFPCENENKYLSEPRTYFFASWDRKKSTFKNGNDYILMTWKIDSTAITLDKRISIALIGFMGNCNFPCYVFRSKNKLYAIAHRQTVNYQNTLTLTEQLRDYIDPQSVIFTNREATTN